MIKLTVEGVVYEFDGDHLLLAEARELKTYTGMSVAKWSRGIDEGDVDAIQALIYLAKKRAGESLRYSDLEQIDYADIDLEPLDDEDEAVEAEPGASQQAADPTPPGDTGTTQTPGTTDTSPPSPTTSSTDLVTSAL
ncbi:hypothetical protein [Streptomyces sp. NPDC006333]|uniref:hypothetical protein n=1 Tax=Streptomyces sp. NPDC006333 TaxID=3156753 RepID=UPI0033ABC22A